MGRFKPLSALAFLASLVLLSLLFSQTNANVIGIDFGTDSYKVAIIKPGIPLDIVLNRESKRKTFPAVAFHDGNRLFGEDAASMSTKHPQKTYQNLFQLLGRKFDDPIAEKYRSIYPVNMIKNETRGTIAFQIDGETSYSVEELVGMILRNAKQQSEVFAGESVSHCVITVPPFFDQFERQAVLDAADIAGLKVLALMNADTAAALNYAMAKKFEEKPTYHIFYDMGAGSTKVSLIGFSTQKVKDQVKGKRAVEKIANIIEVKAVVFDRNLGSIEIDRILANHLADLFQKQKGVTSNVRNNPRAMAKIYKEAQRVKHVLTVNTEAISKIEGLLDNVDLSQRVNRETFEKLCADFFSKVTKPIDALMAQTDIKMEEIESILLVGGGTRVPSVQSALKQIGRELSQTINADEAPVLGATFKGAGMLKRFQVKDNRVRDISTYNVQVEYETEGSTKELIVYDQKSLVGKSKKINFSKTNDFSFLIEYSNEDGLSGKNQIFNVLVKGFDSEKYQTNLKLLKEGEAPKVDVTLTMDESGIVKLEKVESSLRITTTEEREEPTLAGQLWNKVSSFFKGEEKKEEGEGEGEGESNESESSENQQSEEQQKTQSENQSEEKRSEENSEEKTEEKTEETKKTEESKNEEKTEEPVEEKKPETQKKIVNVEKVVRIPLPFDITIPYLAPLAREDIKRAKDKLDELDHQDYQKKLREETFNSLESYVYEKRDFLTSENVQLVSTENERTEFEAALNSVYDWLYEDGQSADTATLRGKLAELKKLDAPISDKLNEYTKRDDFVAKLTEMLKFSQSFIQNVTALKESQYTEEEIAKFSTLVSETEEWLQKSVNAQKEKSLIEEPAFRVKELEEKAQKVAKQLQTLISKPKPKPKPKPKATKKTEEKKAEEKAEEKVEEEKVEETEEPKAEEKPTEETKNEETKAEGKKKRRNRETQEEDKTADEKLELGDKEEL